ncbi:thiamine pyrophosphate-dependent enzyme, partial [Nocardioides sp.]|uniref:thiamine pyrophosphate-dependent enzyme n=1 Tax=Nocardioides sp. TaxID=35761 RepID=UPI0025F5C57F
GAMSPAARAALLALAGRIGAPVATTLRAKDLFRGEPHDLGVFGGLSHPLAAEVIAASDCIVAFGASLNGRTTGGGGLVEGKTVVQVDLDPRRLDRVSPGTVCVAGDAAAVADRIRGWLDEADVPATRHASPELAQRLAASPGPSYAPSVAEGTVEMRRALELVDAAVPEDRILVVDGGRFIYDTWAILHVEHPQWYVHTLSFGSIGLGVASAIGAARGVPGRPVLTVCGDGGFMLGGLAEFSTAVRESLDLIVIVLNDGAYGAEYIQLVDQGLDPRISTVTWPDLACVADALGGTGLTARSEAELTDHLGALGERVGPV